MTNGGISSLIFSEGCEASASTASSTHGVHGWCGKLCPMVHILFAPIFVFGGGTSNSLDPQWVGVLWSQPSVLSLPTLEERSYQESSSSLPPSWAAQNSAHLLVWSSCVSVSTSGASLGAIPPKTRPLLPSEMGRRVSGLLFQVRHPELYHQQQLGSTQMAHSSPAIIHILTLTDMDCPNEQQPHHWIFRALSL